MGHSRFNVLAGDTAARAEVLKIALPTILEFSPNVLRFKFKSMIQFVKITSNYCNLFCSQKWTKMLNLYLSTNVSTEFRSKSLLFYGGLSLRSFHIQ